MPYKASDRNSSVFFQPRNRRKSIVAPGVPIPPGGFRRQPTNTIITIDNNNLNYNNPAVSASNNNIHDETSDRPPVKSTMSSGSVAREAPNSTGQNTAESLSQEMSSQLTLRGQQDRHPEQSTPAAAAMHEQIIGTPQDAVPHPLPTRRCEGSIDDAASASLSSLFVREDTADHSSTPLSLLEFQKYQAIVDKINDRRDDEDPTYVLSEGGCKYYQPPPHAGRIIDEGAVDERAQHAEVREDCISPDMRTESYNSRSEIPSTVARKTKNTSFEYNSQEYSTPTRNKRRSPEPQTASTGKRMKSRSERRPRTFGKRWDQLRKEGQEKRLDILEDIEIIWNRRCEDVIPQAMWLHGEKEDGLPLPPKDWPSNLLEEVKELAQHTGKDRGKAVDVLRRALAHQSAMFGTPAWIYSVNDIKLAISILIRDDRSATPSTVSDSPDEGDDVGRNLDGDLRPLDSFLSTGFRRLPGLHEDEDHLDDRHAQVPDQKPAAPPTTNRASSPQPHSTPAPLQPLLILSSRSVTIKEESTTPPPPIPTGPALLAITTPQTISSLGEDDTYTLKLLIEDEVQRRKAGGKPVPGALSTCKVADVTSWDLIRLGALDFQRLRKMVEADWERRETAGCSPGNAMVID